MRYALSALVIAIALVTQPAHGQQFGKPKFLTGRASSSGADASTSSELRTGVSDSGPATWLKPREEIFDKKFVGRPRFIGKASQTQCQLPLAASEHEQAPLVGHAAGNAVPASVKKALYKGFLQMNCVEFNLLGANYESAERNYRYIGTKKNLYVYTDKKHTIAIDPRTGDSWLQEAPETWKKLTHKKN